MLNGCKTKLLKQKNQYLSWSRGRGSTGKEHPQVLKPRLTKGDRETGQNELNLNPVYCKYINITR